MKKRLIGLVLAAAVLLSGCGGSTPTRKQYQASFLTLFDTVTYISGFAGSEETFAGTANAVYDELLTYHQLFDIYKEYSGINNLKTVNDNAGLSPVEVDPIVIDLLLDCREYYALTGGKVNVAMGSVLALWHEARDESLDDPVNARLPDPALLAEAAQHTSWDTIVIDEEASTVFITDPGQKLDVGAVAKGWATQRAAENAPEGLLLSVGGNVCATGPKDENGTPWIVGINDPDGGDEYLHTLYVTGGSLVTSGDYQRYYEVGGVRYHHIIDPDTLYPAQYWRSVTILCQDSGLADALSTALFLMDLEDGKALLEACGAEAMWVDADGNFYYSNGFEGHIRT